MEVKDKNQEPKKARLNTFSGREKLMKIKNMLKHEKKNQKKNSTLTKILQKKQKKQKKKNNVLSYGSRHSSDRGI